MLPTQGDVVGGIEAVAHHLMSLHVGSHERRHHRRVIQRWGRKSQEDEDYVRQQFVVPSSVCPETQCFRTARSRRGHEKKVLSLQNRLIYKTTTPSYTSLTYLLYIYIYIYIRLEPPPIYISYIYFLYIPL